jgi:hypothetical protein
MSFDMKEDCNAKKRYTPEEIVAKLRQVDVLVSQGIFNIKGNDYRVIPSFREADSSAASPRSVEAPTSPCANSCFYDGLSD